MDEDPSKLTDDEETGDGDGSLGMKEGLGDTMLPECSQETNSIATPDQTESASSSAEHTAQGSREEDKLLADDDPNKAPWPSMVDLNNRLRRVITSYQRNYKKEEMKMAQKAKVDIAI